MFNIFHILIYFIANSKCSNKLLLIKKIIMYHLVIYTGNLKNVCALSLMKVVMLIIHIPFQALILT